MARWALAVCTMAAAGCSILIDSSKYTGGDGGSEDGGGHDAGPSCSTSDGAVPVVCGDCIVGGGEECDDGNTAIRDGCDATCSVEAQLARGGCDMPADLQLVPGPARLVAFAEGNTATSTASTADPGCAIARDALDQVFRLTVPPGGRSVEIHAVPDGWDLAVYVRRAGSCGDPGAEVACADERGLGTPYEQIDTTLPAGSYAIVVDGGATDAAGNYELNVTLFD